MTSLSFDISVLELLWTLRARLQVVLTGGSESRVGSVARLRRRAARAPIDFSLFYFASDERSRAPTSTGCCSRAPSSPTARLRRGVDAGAALPCLRRPVSQPGGHQRRARGDHRARADPRGQRGAAAAPPDPRRRGMVGRRQPLARAGRDLVCLRLAAERLRAERRGSFADAQGTICPRASRPCAGSGEARPVALPGPRRRTVEVRTLPRPVQPSFRSGSPRRATRDVRAGGRRCGSDCSPTCSASGRRARDKIAAYRTAGASPGTRRRARDAHAAHFRRAATLRSAAPVARDPMKEYLRSSLALLAMRVPAFPTPRAGDDEDDHLARSPSEERDQLLELRLRPILSRRAGSSARRTTSPPSCRDSPPQGSTRWRASSTSASAPTPCWPRSTCCWRRSSRSMAADVERRQPAGRQRGRR